MKATTPPCLLLGFLKSADAVWQQQNKKHSLVTIPYSHTSPTPSIFSVQKLWIWTNQSFLRSWFHAEISRASSKFRCQVRSFPRNRNLPSKLDIEPHIGVGSNPSTRGSMPSFDSTLSLHPHILLRRPWTPPAATSTPIDLPNDAEYLQRFIR